jgi:hypothetical protein
MKPSGLGAFSFGADMITCLIYSSQKKADPGVLDFLVPILIPRSSM